MNSRNQNQKQSLRGTNNRNSNNSNNRRNVNSSNNSNSNNRRNVNSRNNSNNRQNVNSRNNSNSNSNNISNNQISNSQQKGNFDKIKKYVIICVVIIVILVVIFFIYKFVTKNVLKIGQNETTVDKQDYLTPFKLPYSQFTLPKNGYDYSMSFWIYVEDYEYNNGLWKHIFHKGNTTNETMEYKDWDTLTTEISRMTPGAWMHPSSNKIRLAFNIKLDDPDDKSCGLYTKSNCEECNMCEYDEDLLLCKEKNSHPKNLEKKFRTKCKSLSTEKNDEFIEFVDIENIPQKEMTHILFVLENKILNIYYNGILKKIHKFAGTPEFSRNDDMYFNFPQTFEGQLFNFRYIPNQINKEKIIEIYKNIPFTNKFTKKYRFDNYIKRFKIIDAVKSMFV